MIPSFENMEALKHDMEVNPHCYTEGYTVFLEDIKETITNEDGTTEEVTYQYMEGTKAAWRQGKGGA